MSIDCVEIFSRVCRDCALTSQQLKTRVGKHTVEQILFGAVSITAEILDTPVDGECAVCHAGVEERHISMSNTLADALSQMYRAGAADKPIHIPSSGWFTNPTQHNCYNQLKYWGLIIDCPDEDGDSKAGHKMISATGVQFLEGQIAVAAKIRVYRDKVTWQSPGRIFFKEALRRQQMKRKRKDYKASNRRRRRSSPGRK